MVTPRTLLTPGVCTSSSLVGTISESDIEMIARACSSGRRGMLGIGCIRDESSAVPRLGLRGPRRSGGLALWIQSELEVPVCANPAGYAHEVALR